MFHTNTDDIYGYAGCAECRRANSLGVARNNFGDPLPGRLLKPDRKWNKFQDFISFPPFNSNPFRHFAISPFRINLASLT